MQQGQDGEVPQLKAPANCRLALSCFHFIYDYMTFPSYLIFSLLGFSSHFLLPTLDPRLLFPNLEGPPINIHLRPKRIFTHPTSERAKFRDGVPSRLTSTPSCDVVRIVGQPQPPFRPRSFILLLSCLTQPFLSPSLAPAIPHFVYIASLRLDVALYLEPRSRQEPTVFFGLSLSSPP